LAKEQDHHSLNFGPGLENELNKYRGLYRMCCNFSHEKPLEKEETLLQDGTIETSVVESKDNVLG
jgi:hypothetical protein